MVTDPLHLHRAPAVDAQLRGLALAADSANRPTMLVGGSAALVALALVFLSWSIVGVGSGRAALRDAQTYASEIDRLSRQIEMHSDEQIDLSALYPRARTIIPMITERIDALGIEFERAPTIGPGSEKIVSQSGRIYQRTVRCRLNSPAPLESILRWIDGILRFDDLEGRAFVSLVSLSPQGAGWTGTFEIGIYEHRP